MSYARRDAKALLRQSAISGRWFVVTEYDLMGDSVVSRVKYDVTDDVRAIERLTASDAIAQAVFLIEREVPSKASRRQVILWLTEYAEKLAAPE